MIAVRVRDDRGAPPHGSMWNAPAEQYSPSAVSSSMAFIFFAFSVKH
jgi:hypothetical protein